MTRPQKRRLEVSSQDLQLVQDLQRQSLSQIRKVRRFERIEVELPVRLEPANSSAIGELVLEGHTCDISRGGCRAIFPGAPRVGDCFRLTIRDDEDSLPLTFARCVRVGLVREQTFDCSFSFFSPLESSHLFEDDDDGGSDLLS